VLVVEDSPDVRKALRLLLAQEGFDVADTDNGSDALRLAQTHGFDAVLTDSGLPDIPGHRVVQGVRERPNADCR
jgi:two-component system KDP operon response regulator KdpE